MIKYRVLSILIVALAIFGNKSNSQEIHPAGLQVFIGGSANIRPIPYYYMNTTERLVISFDLLNYNNDNIYYNVYRQQAYGEAPLQQIQYLKNPQIVEINNGASSMSTRTPYIHYEIAIPNAQVQPILSGDYVVEFYKDRYQSQGEGFMTIPFTIVESQTTVDIHFPFYAVGVDSDKYQQVNISVSGQSDYISNPLNNNISIRVWQNFAQRGINLTQPSQILNNKVVFSDDKGAQFPGGNEYFHFDLLYPEGGGNIGVDSIRIYSNYYKAFLPISHTRLDKPYLFEQDMDGLYRIHTASFTSQNIHTDGEYELVKFSLNCNDIPDFNPQKHHIYLIGEAFSPWGKEMHYDPKSGLMTYLMMIKQGYLDYAFVLRDDNYKEINLGGDHRQTTNTYTALVYVNSPMDLSYKVIGAATLRRTMKNSTELGGNN